MNDPYADLKAHFSKAKDVVVNAGRGAQGMKIGKRMFAMFYKGDLLLTMPPERVSELIGSKAGLPFDPGTGKTMKDRVLIPAAHQQLWIELSEEARQNFG